ncbi:hypothetical protein [Bacillus sp. KH172YL63]|uniref:hypothetical protein n=1 Tax=Bacillus sp. KH172YL63 TaxID=2709784 RepID=UPI0013E4E780|nr:hypothetical protein [Bacillus sp. KH172YL63]BCB02570.1 hypothetical protein KH172YL63_07030 [Bacillus sp. KH172YL63]
MNDQQLELSNILEECQGEIRSRLYLELPAEELAKMVTDKVTGLQLNHILQDMSIIKRRGGEPCHYVIRLLLPFIEREHGELNLFKKRKRT